MGTTANTEVPQHRKNNLIHVLIKDATTKPCCPRTAGSGFNPRTRKGCDILAKKFTVANYVFQPTHLGGDTTSSPRTHPICLSCFNPRILKKRAKSIV